MKCSTLVLLLCVMPVFLNVCNSFASFLNRRLSLNKKMARMWKIIK